MIPPNEWEWYGVAGHLCVGAWCRFHLHTKVGNYIVSTVGEYVPLSASNGHERDEAAWLEENWPGMDIGYKRKYETMVFRWSGERCETDTCGCGQALVGDYSELTCRGYNTRGDATNGHMQTCQEYAEKGESDE